MVCFTFKRHHEQNNLMYFYTLPGNSELQRIWKQHSK